MKFNLPKEWKLAKLGELGEVITGSTPSTSKPEYYGSEVPFVTPVDLDRHDPVTEAENALSRLGAQQARLLPLDSVMVCCIGSLGKVGIAGTQVATNQQINSLIFDKSKIFPRYGYHYCKTLKPIMEHMAPSTTVAIVNKSRFSEITIPFPPLPEQRRIAAILDKADAIRRKRRRAIELTEDFLRSAFLEMFGDPVTNPKGWPLRKFGDVCTTRLGKMLDSKKQTGLHKRPYLRNVNVQWGYFDLKEVLEMDFDENDREEFRLRMGDVLICEGGEVGRAAIWQDELEECYFQKALHRVRPHSNKVIPEYLVNLMWFLAKYGGLKDHVTSATIAHLTGVKLKNMNIPIPPLELQKKFRIVTNKINDTNLTMSH